MRVITYIRLIISQIPNKNNAIDEISVEQKDYSRDCSLIIIDYQITSKITQRLQIILRLLLNFTEIADCLMRLREYFEDYWDYGKITG